MLEARGGEGGGGTDERGCSNVRHLRSDAMWQRRFGDIMTASRTTPRKVLRGTFYFLFIFFKYSANSQETGGNISGPPSTGNHRRDMILKHQRCALVRARVRRLVSSSDEAQRLLLSLSPSR